MRDLTYFIYSKLSQRVEKGTIHRCTCIYEYHARYLDVPEYTVKAKLIWISERPFTSYIHTYRERERANKCFY